MWISESLNQLEFGKTCQCNHYLKTSEEGKNKFSQMDREEDKKKLFYEGGNLREITQSPCLGYRDIISLTLPDW